MKKYEIIFYQIVPTGQHTDKPKAIFQDLSKAKVAFANLKKHSKFDWKIYAILISFHVSTKRGDAAFVDGYRIEKSNLHNARDFYKQIKDEAGELIGGDIGVDETEVEKAITAALLSDNKDVLKVVV